MNHEIYTDFSACKSRGLISKKLNECKKSNLSLTILCVKERGNVVATPIRAVSVSEAVIKYAEKDS